MNKSTQTDWFGYSKLLFTSKEYW